MLIHGNVQLRQQPTSQSQSMMNNERSISHLPPPNWKEKKRLGPRIEQGYRLACQLWISHDIELSQEAKPLADVVAPGAAAV